MKCNDFTLGGGVITPTDPSQARFASLNTTRLDISQQIRSCLTERPSQHRRVKDGGRVRVLGVLGVLGILSLSFVRGGAETIPATVG